jgi:hypothetical protein
VGELTAISPHERNTVGRESFVLPALLVPYHRRRLEKKITKKYVRVQPSAFSFSFSEGGLQAVLLHQIGIERNFHAADTWLTADR